MREGRPTPPEANPTSTEMTRREFLGTLGKATALVGLGHFDTGCASRIQNLKPEEIHAGLSDFYKELQDPHEIMNLTHEDEYIIDDRIFSAYAHTTDKGLPEDFSPAGGYIAENWIDTIEEQKEFQERLRKMGLSEKEIAFYESFFASSDMIVFSDKILAHKEFAEKALPHERIHKKLAHIPEKMRLKMMQAAQDIMQRTTDTGEQIFKARHPNPDSRPVEESQRYWEEFYTFLAQGEFDEAVEDALKNDYLEVYKLYKEIL